jgi:hypothetical protein
MNINEELDLIDNADAIDVIESDKTPYEIQEEVPESSTHHSGETFKPETFSAYEKKKNLDFKWILRMVTFVVVFLISFVILIFCMIMIILEKGDKSVYFSMIAGTVSLYSPSPTVIMDSKKNDKK